MTTPAEIALDRDAVTKQILEIIVKEGMVEESRVVPEATLKSLELDSMAIVMILMAVEEKFNVYVPIDSSLSEATTLQALIDTILDRVGKQQNAS